MSLFDKDLDYIAHYGVKGMTWGHRKKKEDTMGVEGVDYVIGPNGERIVLKKKEDSKPSPASSSPTGTGTTGGAGTKGSGGSGSKGSGGKSKEKKEGEEGEEGEKKEKKGKAAAAPKEKKKEKKDTKLQKQLEENAKKLEELSKKIENMQAALEALSPENLRKRQQVVNTLMGKDNNSTKISPSNTKMGSSGIMGMFADSRQKLSKELDSLKKELK